MEEKKKLEEDLENVTGGACENRRPQKSGEEAPTIVRVTSTDPSDDHSTGECYPLCG